MHEREQGHYGEYLDFRDPIYRSGSKHLRRGTEDLNYLDLQISADYSDCHDRTHSVKKEFHSKGQIMEGSTGCASPFRTASPRNVICKESPLLPYYHHCRYLPSPKGVQAAADARQALTELIERMPESSCELSFNVYVEEQKSMEESQEAIVEEKMDSKSKGRIEQKNKNPRLKVFHRSESDISANYRLKVSLPVSLGSNKKQIGRCMSLPREPLRKVSEKPAKKEWWKMLCPVTGEVPIMDMYHTSDCTSRSNSISSSNSTNSSSNRWLSESNLTPGRRYSSSRFRGCLF